MAIAETITSLQNERIKAIRALEMRKERRETGLFVAEGVSVIETARQRGIFPETLVHLAGSLDTAVARAIVTQAHAHGARILEVSAAVLAKIAAKENPQSLIGVFHQRWSELPARAAMARTTTWLALEEVRDPGNLGTIIRTADAVGAAGVILVGACCDPYSREAIRATMGSIFSVPLVAVTREAFLAFTKAWPGEVVGTAITATEDVRMVTWREPVLLVMGSEGPGLSDGLTAAMSRLVRIPMVGRLDSLNLSVATALCLYEVRRRHLQI
ncbi:MAG TPA: RNA methyltransferase [Hyphomicrobiaceae bacterium]|nr:RNA methyltransferase [Hyphomicrobiaceae bacterium]